MNRRAFLTSSMAVGVSLFPSRILAAASKSRIRLGGPIFNTPADPIAIAREHRRLGYGAAYCPEMATLSDSKLLHAIARAFADENVVIAEVGAWKNLLDPDPVKRRSTSRARVTSSSRAAPLKARRLGWVYV